MTGAVICIRVSPRPAENVRYSPEIQERKCREWCATRGIPVVRVIQDILVSGGASNRFDSIMRALTEDQPTHFVVQNIDRWTKDHPKRYWVIRAMLEEQGITLVSVEQPFLNEDIPFSATIATATVEANYIQRIESNKKTSLGVRTAWAKGKRFGTIWGWTFDPQTRQYTQDVPRIKSFFADYANGLSTHALGRKYGVRPSHVTAHLRAVSQRDVVGDELWGRTQERLNRRTRVQRWDAAQSNLYRGLMFCPYCGRRMTHHSAAWNNYRCVPPRQGQHDWTMISATTHVEPRVREIIDRLYVPEDQAAAVSVARSAPLTIMRADPEEIRQEIERHAISWAKGRISESRYEALVAELEAELAAVPAPPPEPEHQVEMIRSLASLDLQERDADVGRYVNIVLRELFKPFTIHEDRSVDVELRPEYQHWLVTRPRLMVVGG